MFILTVVLAATTAAGFMGAGVAKLAGLAGMAAAQRHLGLPLPLWKIVGGLEIIGGVGLIVGLFSDLIVVGVLAAAGLVALTIGATYYHQRAGDRVVAWLPAVAMGSLAIFYAIARIGSS